MTERSTFDAFERRLAAEFEAYVELATDPRPTTEIAKMAMQPRGLAVRARNASGRRRILLLGIAAAFLVPAAYIGAGGLRPAVPDQATRVQPSSPTDVPATALPSIATSSAFVSIFVRRDDGPEPGISVFAVRPDGHEALVRKVPDSILSGSGTLAQGGTVSESGWIAIGVENSGGPWPMILIDLRDPNSQPWVINEANLGGIGPHWGPTGLIAASAVDPTQPTSISGDVVIADPDTHVARTISMQGHGLIGGGPSIVWTADGSGIAAANAGGTYDIIPIDGSDPRPGVGEVFDPRGNVGPGLAGLQICSPGAKCAGRNDGRIERTGNAGSATTIWRQTGSDRALAAGFGRAAGEYWLTLDHDAGRQVALVHVQDGRQDGVATINRGAAWQGLGAPVEAPDRSAAELFIDVGAKPAAVVLPLDGEPPTFHTGQFAGFVDRAASAVFGGGSYGPPPDAMPAAGEPFALASLDQLIAAELALNPGRTVIGKAAGDAVSGQADVRTFTVTRDRPGAGEAYLDCSGPSSVSVTSGLNSVVSPCLAAGANVGTIDASGPITVRASGDTSWRVVLYTP